MLSKLIDEKHFKKLPIRISDIINDLNLNVRSVIIGHSNYSGEIQERDGQYKMSVNRFESLPRQRFTVALLIAHFILHKELIGQEGLVVNVINKTSSKADDEKACSLAADIITPVELLAKEYEKFKHLKKKQIVREMSELFRVPEDMMKIRLEILNDT